MYSIRCIAYTVYIREACKLIKIRTQLATRTYRWVSHIDFQQFFGHDCRALATASMASLASFDVELASEPILKFSLFLLGLLPRLMAPGRLQAKSCLDTAIIARTVLLESKRERERECRIGVQACASKFRQHVCSEQKKPTRGLVVSHVEILCAKRK